jgi:hypothetical protein
MRNIMHRQRILTAAPSKAQRRLAQMRGRWFLHSPRKSRTGPTAETLSDLCEGALSALQWRVAGGAT